MKSNQLHDGIAPVHHYFWIIFFEQQAHSRNSWKQIGSRSSGIEELFFKREELNKQIQQEEEEKTRLQHDIRVLTEKLNRVCESLDRRLTTRNELDRTIAETEAAYMKVKA